MIQDKEMVWCALTVSQTASINRFKDYSSNTVVQALENLCFPSLASISLHFRARTRRPMELPKRAFKQLTSSI